MVNKDIHISIQLNRVGSGVMNMAIKRSFQIETCQLLITVISLSVPSGSIQLFNLTVLILCYFRSEVGPMNPSSSVVALSCRTYCSIQRAVQSKLWHYPIMTFLSRSREIENEDLMITLNFIAAFIQTPLVMRWSLCRLCCCSFCRIRFLFNRHIFPLFPGQAGFTEGLPKKDQFGIAARDFYRPDAQWCSRVHYGQVQVQVGVP